MRRLIAAGLAATLGWKGAWGQKPEARPPTAPAAPEPPSSVRPRHVLCFLGKTADLAPLQQAASAAVRDVATGFSVDGDYSTAKPDARMPRSFEVNRDRVLAHAWSTADEQAVASHRSVLYVLGPPMDRQNTVQVSMAALQLVGRVLDAGAVAAKGESAGVAHGIERWRELVRQGAQALQSGDLLAQQRVGRLAFARRPISDKGYLQSVGFHLVGLPEVYVPQSMGTELQAVALMDAVADEMAQRGLAQVLKERRATHAFASSYEEDDFKFNPYGIVRLAR